MARTLHLLCFRFISYDFKKMQRRSYFPSNEQTTSTITATSSNESRPVTPALFDRPDVVQEVDLANGVPISDYEIDPDCVQLEKVLTEKNLPSDI